MPAKACGKRLDTGEVVTLSITESRITGFQPGVEGDALGGPELWLSPGFFDLQVNGYGGRDFNLGDADDASGDQHDLGPLFDALARSGTALFCPTILTNSAERITAALTHVSHALNSEPSWARRVPGIHLEGPYFSAEAGPRGAHPLAHVRDPDWDEFQRFQEAAEGRIKLCTLAPERDGALPFIEKLVASGVVVALGHTAASASQISDAVSAGARLSTHLGNGSHALLPRHPNYIWEQLAHDDLYATIIADGEHLPVSVVKCFARIKGAERLALVSDAVALGGLPAGLYDGGRHEVLPSGRVVLAGTPYLAGAGVLLDVCIANALRFTDLSLAQVMGCVSAIPARILGLEDRKGHLQVGYDAELTLFHVPEAGPLEIAATVCAGEVIYRA
ncbi:MAG: amidohydrolase family protein [Armatimonadota bacterium]|nr:amidohydrolase family protein [Armatimonadota bacterium]